MRSGNDSAVTIIPIARLVRTIFAEGFEVYSADDGCTLFMHHGGFTRYQTFIFALVEISFVGGGQFPNRDPFGYFEDRGMAGTNEGCFGRPGDVQTRTEIG